MALTAGGEFWHTEGELVSFCCFASGRIAQRVFCSNAPKICTTSANIIATKIIWSLTRILRLIIYPAFHFCRRKIPRLFPLPDLPLAAGDGHFSPPVWFNARRKRRKMAQLRGGILGGKAALTVFPHCYAMRRANCDNRLRECPRFAGGCSREIGDIKSPALAAAKPPQWIFLVRVRC